MMNIEFRNKTIGLLSFLLIMASCSKAPEKQNVESLNLITSHKLEDALNFIVVSDWGWNGYNNQQEVARQMGQTADSIDAEFVVSCGDNFQINGIASTQDPLWMKNFENVYTANSLQVDWFPVLGNHDYEGNTQAQIDYSKISRRWRLTDHYYTFAQKVNDSISARLIFLDTPPFIEAYHKNPSKYPDVALQDTAKQIAWLKNVLETSTEQFILIFGHHPVYSASSKHGDTPELKEKLEPLLEKYNVDYYISGHDHDFQHLKPSNKTVQYIVNGTGGKIRTSESNENTIFNISKAGFTIVSLKGTQLQILYADTAGNCIYQTEKTLY